MRRIIFNSFFSLCFEGVFRALCFIVTLFHRGSVCQDRPALGDRSIVHTFTFDVVEDTGSNLTSNFSFIKTFARASIKTYLPGSPGIATKRVG